MGGDTTAKAPVFNPPAASREINRDIDLALKGGFLPHDRLSELSIKDILGNDRPNVIRVTVEQLPLASTSIQAKNANMIENAPL